MSDLKKKIEERRAREAEDAAQKPSQGKYEAFFEHERERAAKIKRERDGLER